MPRPARKQNAHKKHRKRKNKTVYASYKLTNEYERLWFTALVMYCIYMYLQERRQTVTPSRLRLLLYSPASGEHHGPQTTH